MIRINLLPVRAAKKKESLRLQLSIAGLVTLAVIIVTVAVFLIYSNEAATVKDDIAKSEEEIRQLKEKIGELSTIQGQKRVLEDKIRIVEQLEEARTGPVKLMSQLSLAMPEKAWIYSMFESGGQVRVMGLAAYDDIVADFMRNLERWKLRDVDLTVVSRGKDVPGVPNSKDLVDFTLSFTK